MLVLVTMLAGCARPATTPEALPTDGSALPQAAVYPGAEWAWASSPESLGWSSDKLALARAYSERIGSAAVMIVDNGVVIDAWGDLERKYRCHSVRKGLISALYGIYVADGLLFLRNGRWGEQQVIPVGWVRESTASHSMTVPQSGYGYLWWTGEEAGLLLNVDGGPGSYLASGAYGQNVIVMPSRNLVVVHHG